MNEAPISPSPLTGGGWGEGLSLTLLVTRVAADDEHPSLPLHQLAILANAFDARTNFHGKTSVRAESQGIAHCKEVKAGDKVHLRDFLPFFLVLLASIFGKIVSRTHCAKERSSVVWSVVSLSSINRSIS